MEDSNNKQRLLRLAVDRLGRDNIAPALGVPVSLLNAWLGGHASMPDRKFLLLADLLDDLSGPREPE